MRQRICVVGMLDSVHFAKWLENFKDLEIDFVIFPSKKFRHLHPILRSLIRSNAAATFRTFSSSIPNGIQGYFSFMLFDLLPPLGKRIRRRLLCRTIRSKSIGIVHALELQGAGYLVNSMIKRYSKSDFKLIVTNYGSDIYFYKKFEEHKRQIEELLSHADFYSAECIRDYNLATEMGFRGIFLPCFPNAGGFDLEMLKNAGATSLRNLIIVKSYGGIFGRGDLGIKVAGVILAKNPSVNFFFYSVTPDLIAEIKGLSATYPGRVRFATVSNSIPQDELLQMFCDSRIYLGLSESDGISTSFLNALVTGAYPIQSGTSCANEWVERGAIASIVPLEIDKVILAVEEAINNTNLLDNAQRANLQIANSTLDRNKIRSEIQSFYE